MNPFKSRSTLICIACLLTVIALNFMALKADKFTMEFAVASMVVVTKIIDSVFNHQKNNNPNPPPQQ